MDNKWETKGLVENHFHSSRAERLQMGGISEEVDKKTFFQRNPSYKIFLIDLIFIVIISGVIVPFIVKREGSTSMSGYKLALKAFDYDDQVMAALSITGTEKISGTGNMVEAVFYYESGDEKSVVTDILPESSKERILKTNLKSGGIDYILCDVLINGEFKTIKKKIK